jgi:hypothetical protein
MKFAPLAAIAGVALDPDQLDQGLPAQAHGQGPGFRLGQLHQRGLDGEVPRHSQVQRRLHGVQGVAPAVGIAGEVGLAHAADQGGQAPPVGEGRRVDEEGQVTARHEGRGQAPPGHFDGPVRRQRRVGDGAKAPEIQHMILAQARRPGGKTVAESLEHRLAGLHLDPVTLSIVEADRLHPAMPGQRPGQADRRVLPAGKQHQGAGVLNRHRGSSAP